MTGQIIHFVKICGELRREIATLETLIAEERQNWDMTVVERSRYNYRNIFNRNKLICSEC